MPKMELVDDPTSELSAEKIREQLELLVQDHVFRSSKRSVEFLRYVVDQTLNGAADQIKERSIGIGVFGREPSYDTNLDHVVRTAAIELRKRLAIYYGDERHRSELRIMLVPGSYIPRFTLPAQTASDPAELEIAPSPANGQLRAHDAEAGFEAAAPKVAAATPPAAKPRGGFRPYLFAAVAAFCILAYSWPAPKNAEDLFWAPILETSGPVLVAVGEAANGPPTASAAQQDATPSLPVLHITASAPVPFGDTVTIARVVGLLEAHEKKVFIRRESLTLFSDLREGPVILIGAFDNEWSLRLTHELRYSLALDAARHLIYIKDAKNPSGRSWSWATDQPTPRQPGNAAPATRDYALISRIWNSETGHTVVIIGGLYTHGTQAAGELLTDPQLMQAVAKGAPLGDPHKNLQIVLETDLTDGTPGPPKVVAVSSE